MNEFPRMLYRFPGVMEKLQDGVYDTKQVNSDGELIDALAHDWHRLPIDAKAAHDSASFAEKQPAIDVAPPTRAELEAKAVELKLDFDGRTSNRKLGALIEKTLADRA